MKIVFPSNFNFSQAPIYRKALCFPFQDVKFATVDQEVITHYDGQPTTIKAYVGDAIIKNAIQQHLVLSGKQFFYLYEKLESQNIYIYKNKVAAIQLTESFEMEAPWGEIQQASAGSFVVKSMLNSDVYFIQEQEFKAKYVPLLDS